MLKVTAYSYELESISKNYFEEYEYHNALQSLQ